MIDKKMQMMKKTCIKKTCSLENDVDEINMYYKNIALHNVMKKHVYIIKTFHLMMQMKKTYIIKNIALDDVDEKTCIIKTSHLMMQMKNMY